MPSDPQDDRIDTPEPSEPADPSPGTEGDDPAQPAPAGESASAKRRRRRKRARSPFDGRQTGVSGVPPRHHARILALQTLYEHDLTEHTLEELGQRMREDDAVPPAVRDYAETLVFGVHRLLETIDGHIGGAATAFPVAQLAAIDRNVLRIAVYELLKQRRTVPVGVAVHEAVEIAKDFGGLNSGRFVHGVLGTISRRLEAAETA